MICTACKATSHKLTRVVAGSWLCGACKFERNSAIPVVKDITVKPPMRDAIKLICLLHRIAVGSVPDHSRN